VIVDSLVFPGEGLLETLDGAGIDRAIVCPPKPRGQSFAVVNDLVARTVSASPERLAGYCRVDPTLTDAVQEAERALGGLGCRGLFLHPWEDTFRISDPTVDPLCRLGVPVIVAAGYPWVSEALQVGELARRHPDTTFAATNGGQLNISGLGQQDAELALAASPNLYLQTTGVYREDFLEKIAERHGAGRLLFASGFPAFDPRLELLRVQWAPNLDVAARAAILGGNAARLLLGDGAAVTACRDTRDSAALGDEA
jgi:predicted TIM-barrel fold metal-dependent hydrolase